MMSKAVVHRLRGVTASIPLEAILPALRAALVADGVLAQEDMNQITRLTIAHSCYAEKEICALFEWRGERSAFLPGLSRGPFDTYTLETDQEDWYIDRHFLGMTPLHTPNPPDNAAADVIAICGLDGHAYGSFSGRSNRPRMWLRDFLPRDLPNCRILTYGYNAKLASRGIDSILDYSRSFLEELKKIRPTPDAQTRPLFFVAHSFGGIVLAHSLVSAALANGSEHGIDAAVYKATYGMLLFGIPHKGMMVDEIRKMIPFDDREGRHPRHLLLDQIRQNSDILLAELSRFKNIIKDRRVVTFYEQLQTPGPQKDLKTGKWFRDGLHEMQVDPESAVLQLPDFMETKIPLNADHSSMVKPDTREDKAYTSAAQYLRQFEKDAKDVVAMRFNTHQNGRPTISDGSRKIVQGIDLPEELTTILLTDPTEKQRQLAGSWLRNELDYGPESELNLVDEYLGPLIPSVWDEFITGTTISSWLHKQASAAMLIQGRAASGKTMLMLRLCQVLHQVDERSGPEVLLHSFCDATPSKSMNASGVLRSWILQLITQRPSLFIHLRKDIDPLSGGLLSGRSSFTNLWDIFSSLASHQSCVCILDTPSTGNHDLWMERLVSKLFEHARQAPPDSPRFKCLIAMRPGKNYVCTQMHHSVMNLDDSSLPHFRLRYARAIVQEKAHFASEVALDDAADELLNHAGGSLLVLSLARNVTASLTDIQGFVEACDTNLRSLVLRVLNQFELDLVPCAILMISIIGAAVRPLTLVELAFVLSTSINNSQIEVGSLVSQWAPILELRNKTVAFTHRTLSNAAFQLQSFTPHGSKSALPISEGAGHTALAKVSFSVVQQHWRALGSLEDNVREKRYPLITYAYQNWAYHYHKSPNPENYRDFATIRAQEFLNGPVCRLWWTSTWSSSASTQSLSIPRQFTQLHFACAFGIRALVEHVVFQHTGSAERSNAQDGHDATPLTKSQCSDGKTALMWAAQSGSSDIIDFLFEHAGADIWDESDFHGTALHIAAIYGQIEAARTILDLDEQINSRSDTRGQSKEDPSARLVNFVGKSWYGSPIQAAAMQGEIDVVELLWSKGARLETGSGGFLGSPLHAAALNGSRSVVAFLLDHGADPESFGGWFKTPLIAAASMGHLAVVAQLCNVISNKKSAASSPASRNAVTKQLGLRKLVKSLPSGSFAHAINYAMSSRGQVQQEFVEHKRMTERTIAGQEGAKTAARTQSSFKEAFHFAVGRALQADRSSAIALVSGRKPSGQPTAQSAIKAQSIESRNSAKSLKPVINRKPIGGLDAGAGVSNIAHRSELGNQDFLSGQVEQYARVFHYNDAIEAAEGEGHLEVASYLRRWSEGLDRPGRR